jgi:hypothetical protein
LRAKIWPLLTESRKADLDSHSADMANLIPVAMKTETLAARETAQDMS